jgi:hypothetical protein
MGIFVGGGIVLGAGVTLTSPPPPVYGSLYFSDGTTDALTLPSVLNLTIETSFTIEAWIYSTGLNTTTVIIGDILGGSTNWYLSVTNDKLNFYWTDGIYDFNSAGDTTILENEWTHVALSVAFTNIQLFVNGQSQTITGPTNFVNTPSTTNQLMIGNQSFDASDAFLGYITNLRINDTASVYSTTFTPQIPLSNIAGTTLLLLVQDTAPFADSSLGAATVTDLGSVAYDAEYP